MRKLKDWVKHSSPKPFRSLITAGFHYAHRIRLWGLTLTQVRGQKAGDVARLWGSALAGPLSALGSLDRWEGPRLLFDTQIRVPDVGVFKCRAGMDDLFHVLPAGQRTVFREIQKRLAHGDVFIDAGANLGFFTVLGAKLVGVEGQVMAVEMMPDMAAILRSHVVANRLPQVEIIEAALADLPDQIVTAHVPIHHAGQASIVETKFVEGSVKVVEVRTTTFDNLTSRFDAIALMKVDLEGAEAQAFLGAAETLRKTSAIICEAWPEDERGRAAIEALASAGFTITNIDRYNILARRT